MTLPDNHPNREREATMSRYRIVVGRRIYQQTTIIVTDETNKKAMAAAIAKAKDPGVAWDIAEENDPSISQAVYFIEDSVLEEK
jgi:hypothetical protein